MGRPALPSKTAIVPRPVPKMLVLGMLPVASWFVIRPLLDPAPPIPGLYTSIGFSIFASLATLHLVPALGQKFVDSNLFGRDLLKTYDTPIPESMGLVTSLVYIITLLLFIPFAFSTHFTSADPNHGLVVKEFPHHQLSVYLSSILSILIATLLGFLDDIFDIRWRHKLPVPIIASIPLLMVYFAERGNTDVVVPRPLRFFLGSLINLGPLYYVYMAMLSTFTTNGFNILAGINGSEVSQAVIIGISVILNDLLYLPWPVDFRIPVHILGGKSDVEFGGVWSAGMSYGSQQLVERHLFSLYFMLPLVAICLGFMYQNWYPARAFPGDTLCYMTGMTFSVVGIQAHYSKTLGLFFMPQIFNFVLSGPQVFGLVPCPRHRVPRFDPNTNLLHYSHTEPFKKPLSQLGTLALQIFSMVGLAKVTWRNGVIVETSNLTILNFFLVRLGPMTEKKLVQVLMATQIAGSVLAFFIRYGLAQLVYDGDRR